MRSTALLNPDAGAVAETATGQLLGSFLDAAFADAVLPTADARIARGITRAGVFSALGMDPDPWQQQLLESQSQRILVLCSRQVGKSQTAAAKALATALLDPPAEILIVSRAQRQSGELLRKVKELYSALCGGRVKRRKWQPKTLKHELIAPAELTDDQSASRDNVLSMEFNNGSRIISLPSTAETIVGFSAIDLLIIDEAARTSDQLYLSLRPMLMVSKGQLLVLSSPYGRRGWFYKAWNDCEEAVAKGRKPAWERISVRADEVERIDKEWLEQERMDIGDRWFRQEYLCSFEADTGAVFDYEFVQAAIRDCGDPIFGALNGHVQPLYASALTDDGDDLFVK